MPISNIPARSPEYRTLDLLFTRNRITDDVDTLSGIDAIKRSIKNLINLNYYEKPFQPYIGSNIRKLLFSNVNAMTAILLKDAIINTIQNFEPRVSVQNVEIIPDPDNNRYTVTLTTSVVNILAPIKIELFLTRIN